MLAESEPIEASLFIQPVETRLAALFVFQSPADQQFAIESRKSYENLISPAGLFVATYIWSKDPLLI